MTGPEMCTSLAHRKIFYHVNDLIISFIVIYVAIAGCWILFKLYHLSCKIFYFCFLAN